MLKTLIVIAIFVAILEFISGMCKGIANDKALFAKEHNIAKAIIKAIKNAFSNKEKN